MKIGIIGFGAASIGYVEEMKESEHELFIFEMSKDVISSSLSGIRSDGKIFISKDMGGTLDIDLVLQREVVDFYLKKSELDEKDIEHGISFDSDKNEWYSKFYSKGFRPINSEFFHIGTDILKTVMKNIYEDLVHRKNVHYIFQSLVKNVDRLNDKEVKITYLDLSSNEEKTVIMDHVIIGVGRSGHKLVDNIIKEAPTVALQNTTVDLGVRFELPNHVVTKLNEEMYEFKVKLKTETGYEARTFCNNPSGYVTLENYNSGELFTVNGHAKAYEKSQNTNFAILVTHRFTEPFKDPVGYGTHISKLSNILAGGQKVILQCFGDFKEYRRTKRIGRVEPTLDKEYYILGDLNLVFPSKTRNSIVDFIEKLDEVVPGVAFDDNLLYGVEVKFYSSVLDNSYFNNIKFIGDCSGWSRSITYASCHGIMQAKEDKITF
ncbi:MAG: NAD(P)/FAD-dependent oxidoreductase [Fusobacteria bacterium]|nr:NAD(P)/FAD-dependent oxidoreductase [Fusobacteriota bacterium]